MPGRPLRRAVEAARRSLRARDAASDRPPPNQRVRTPPAPARRPTAGDSADRQAPEPRGGREPSLEELKAAATHAASRLALYRRKIYGGGGEPRRLAELERISEGAASRLRRALRRR